MGGFGTAQLTLELELEPRRIRGSLREGGGAARPFDGWVQLTGALEAAHADACARSARTTDSPDPPSAGPEPASAAGRPRTETGENR